MLRRKAAAVIQHAALQTGEGERENDERGMGAWEAELLYRQSGAEFIFYY